MDLIIYGLNIFWGKIKYFQKFSDQTGIIIIIMSQVR